MYDNLPELCYSKLLTDGTIIIIKRGESGYYPTDFPKESDVDWLNSRLGVTKGQAEAMLVGSMNGWDVPGANPDNYDDNGMWKYTVTSHFEDFLNEELGYLIEQGHIKKLNDEQKAELIENFMHNDYVWDVFNDMFIETADKMFGSVDDEEEEAL